ncbi:MAG: hypothetical protein FJ294_04940 [Planctomycetes bacterium]|nr:hypothetical protein [Planctomycetota bacterium]
MARSFLKLAADIPGLDALGVRELDDLFAEPPRTVTAQRAHLAGTRFVVPLPGTPDEAGLQHEKPRGAGTGLLHVERFGRGGFAGLSARFTHPRSTSLAARAWNLACHLQAHGVATPQLVALAERGASPFCAESVLVTRELEGFVSLREFLRTTDKRSERRRALHSLALTLVQVERCGAWLPATTADNVMVQRDDEDCVAIKIVNLHSEQALLRERGLSRSRLPSVALTSFAGGSLRGSRSPTESEAWLVALDRDVGAALSHRERLEFLVRLGFTRPRAAALAARC